MKTSLLSLSALFVLGCSAPKQQPEINDSNTPLHLMQPDYDTPYGIPTEDSIKQTIDRVLGFLEEAMPAAVEDNRLVRGSLRLTSYEAGVLYAAAINAAEATGDERYLKFVQDRLTLIAEQAPKEADSIAANRHYDGQMRMVLHPGALDDCGAMAAAYCRLNMAQPNAAYDEVIDRYVNYVRYKQFRLKNGIFARNRPHHNTVWLDDIYMGVPCMAWYGTMKNDASVVREAVEQIRLFKEIMWVPEKKLFRHGWVESMQPHHSYHWGRANGWAVLTLCEVLDAVEAMPQGANLAKERDFVLDLLRQHVEGLSVLQDKTGFWHQLLDRPDTYLETSCTAIYAYCMAHAINRGWIDVQAYGAQVLLAWQAVQTKVNAKGEVEGTCVGTGMGFDPAFYAYRPVHKMAAHGYGPALWAGAEVLKMLKSTHPKMNDSAVRFYLKEQKTNRPIFSEADPEEDIQW